MIEDGLEEKRVQVAVYSRRSTYSQNIQNPILCRPGVGRAPASPRQISFHNTCAVARSAAAGLFPIVTDEVCALAPLSAMK